MAGHLKAFISKTANFKIPMGRHFMQRSCYIATEQNNIKSGLNAVLRAISLIKSDATSIAVFPEGTRSKDNTLLEFKPGCFKIAEKTNCAILPMAITNSADILENHFPKVKPTHVILQYGKPIYIKDIPKEEQRHLASYVQKNVEALLNDNKTML